MDEEIKVPTGLPVDPVDDFAEFYLEETAVIDIHLPDGKKTPMLFKGKPVRIEMYGPATEQHARASAKLNRFASETYLKSMQISDNKPDPDKQAEAEEAANLQFLVEVTKEIHNFPFPGGPKAVYSTRKLLYMANQARAGLQRLENFFKGGKTQ